MTSLGRGAAAASRKSTLAKVALVVLEQGRCILRNAYVTLPR